MPRPGWAEHDAETIWWRDATNLIRELLPARPEQVRAVCISGIGPCVQLTDVDARPLRPAILYGVDTRAVSLGETLQERLGGAEAVLDRCGCVITSQSAGPKIAWVRVNEPDLWAQARKFFMAHTYVAHRLTGAYVLDHHSASQCTPLYDRRTRHWINEWADEIAPRISLPELRWPTEAAGHVTADAADAAGLAARTLVAVGTIDAWAEADSVDVREPGDLMLMYGSTMFFVGVSERPVLAPELWSTAGNYPGQYTLAAGMASAGSITEWFRDLVGAATFDELIGQAAKADPGANGLLALPYFAGERTPIADPLARGVIAGLTLRHTRGDIYRALLEATAFGVRHNLEAFTAAGFTPRRQPG
jgi:xylulokinase